LWVRHRDLETLLEKEQDNYLVGGSDKTCFVQPAVFNQLLVNLPLMDWQWRIKKTVAYLPLIAVLVVLLSERVWLESFTRETDLSLRQKLPVFLYGSFPLLLLLCIGTEVDIRLKRRTARQIKLSSKCLELCWTKPVVIAWKNVKAFRLCSLSDYPGSTLLEIDYGRGRRLSTWRIVLRTISDRDALLAQLKHHENYREAGYTVTLTPGESRCEASPIRKINYVRLLLGASTLMHGIALILFAVALLLPIWGWDVLKGQTRNESLMTNSRPPARLIEYVSHFNSVQSFKLSTSFFLFSVGSGLILIGGKILPANTRAVHPNPEPSRTA
jgi:hypothetical protein